jgi:hypothetical protein
MTIRPMVPEHHFGNEARDVLRLGLGLITTMNALILGLLISTAKSSYDAKRNQLTQMAADAILVDRSLAIYGSETDEIRKSLRELFAKFIDHIQAIRDGRRENAYAESEIGAADFYQSVRKLKPRDDGQKSLKAEALQASFEIAQIRALELAQESNSVPTAFLVVLAFWLVVIFTGYGLFAPPNLTVAICLGIFALCVSAAVLMILSMDQPFSGIVQISAEPLSNAMSVLGK